MAERPCAIEMRGITKTFGSVVANDRVWLDIYKGEILALLGENGSGKTTLMNILSALDAPTEGDVSFDGQVYSEMEDAQKEQLRRKEIGFVFQAVALIPIMNAYENVDFAMRLAEPELTAKEVDERIRETLALVGMEERMRHMPGQMSGGEQQRVAIARAVAHRPKVVFADEPTGALDSKTSRDILILLEEINRKYGTTMLIVTHNNSIKNMVHKVLIIKDGLIHKSYENEVRVPARELEDL